MTIIYDMAAGSIRSDTQNSNRDKKQTDKHAEITPDIPAPALREFEPGTLPEPDSIHLVRGLLKKD